ncbi:hypothetical protein PYCC9005_005233 [Savitreella phatthalungensis]
MARTSKAPRPFTTLMSTIVGLAFLWFFIRSSSSGSSRAGPLLKLNTGVPVSNTIKRYNLNAVSSTSHALENKERVLILTPVVKFYDEYWKNLLKLTYPRELLDIGFIVPKGSRGNAVLMSLEKAVQKVQTSRNKFASVTILKQDFDTSTGQTERERHAKDVQKQRRSELAMARNQLLISLLGPATSWVLHLDADITETPISLIEDLTAQNKDVLVPNCYQRYTTDEGSAAVRPYDYNSWRDSPTALDMAKTMGKDEVLLEGYADMATYRTLMAYMRTDDNFTGTRLEELDGVGGTALLVRADVHRDGGFFPSFAYEHLIETEGFARMSQRLGYKCWGMPDYLVFHHNE